MNSAVFKQQVPQLEHKPMYNSQDYELYKHKNQRIYTLVNKVSQQVEYVIWQKQWEETHIFNGFEAGSIKAQWHSKHRDNIFHRHLWLTNQKTQKNLTKKILSHETALHKKKQRKLKLESQPLNDEIPDGIFEYTNGKNQVFEIWILWWRIRNISHTHWDISSAQKAAITRAVKNYWKDNHSDRLKKYDHCDKWNTISQYIIDINDTKIEENIVELFLKIWDTSDGISKQQIQYIIEIYRYYSQFSNLQQDEQLQYLQSNHHIGFLFSWIIARMKDESIENIDNHIKRLSILKNIIEQWNNQKTQN